MADDQAPAPEPTTTPDSTPAQQPAQQQQQPVEAAPVEVAPDFGQQEFSRGWMPKELSTTVEKIDKGK